MWCESGYWRLALDEEEALDMKKSICQFCIYTIKDRNELAIKAETGQRADLSERKLWVTGEKLWHKAVADGEAMPILLGDAADCSHLLYRGFLTDVRPQPDGGTSFSVDRIRRIKGRHSQQELVLRLTGKTIKPKFIRPYAICRTPGFVIQQADGK
jgi:hypothetical protein